MHKYIPLGKKSKKGQKNGACCCFLYLTPYGQSFVRGYFICSETANINKLGDTMTLNLEDPVSTVSFAIL